MRPGSSQTTGRENQDGFVGLPVSSLTRPGGLRSTAPVQGRSAVHVIVRRHLQAAAVAAVAAAVAATVAATVAAVKAKTDAPENRPRRPIPLPPLQPSEHRVGAPAAPEAIRVGSGQFA